jgi:hypothetical protein
VELGRTEHVSPMRRFEEVGFGNRKETERERELGGEGIEKMGERDLLTFTCLMHGCFLVEF